MAIGSSAGVSLVDSHSGFELAVIPVRDPMHIQFDESGDLLTYSLKGFHRWPIQWKSRRRILQVRSPESLFRDVRVRVDVHCSASRNGTVVAMAIPGSDAGPSDAGAMVMHQSKAGGEVRKVVAGPQFDVRRCAVSPDGKWVATGSHLPAPNGSPTPACGTPSRESG